jgi:hypothetical protein
MKLRFETLLYFEIVTGMQTVTAKLYPGSGVDLFSKGKAQMF